MYIYLDSYTLLLILFYINIYPFCVCVPLTSTFPSLMFFFSSKCLFIVGEPLRNTPAPGGGDDLLRTLSPTSNQYNHHSGRVSPLPKWARGIFLFLLLIYA